MDLGLAVNGAMLLGMVAYCIALSTGCGISPDYRWVNQGVDASIDCMTSNPKWWIASDPCQSDNATELVACSGGSNICTVPSETYNSMESCVVCCTEGTVSIFTPSAVTSCGKIGVCPRVSYAYPTIATAGSTIEFFTFVATKPRPPPTNISVLVNYYNKDPVLAVQRENVFVVQGTNNNFTFVNVIHLPHDVSSAIVEVNLSAIPRGEQCSFQERAIFHINVLQGYTYETTATTSSSPSTSGLSSSTENSFQVDSISLGIGVGSTIVIMVILILFIAVTILALFKCSHSKSKKSKLTGGNCHLLTATGTPITTPSSESQHTLGHQISETPASTPTEFHTLLDSNGTNNHYQEISLNGGGGGVGGGNTSNNANSPSCRSTTLIIVGSGVQTPPMGSGVPPPQHPPPTYVPSPPKAGAHSEARPTTLHPSPLPNSMEYATHGEAMHLTSEYNQGDEKI